MRYIKLSKYREHYFEEDSRPDIRTLRRWIDDGILAGKKMRGQYFVDLHAQEGTGQAPRPNSALARKTLEAMQ